MNPKTEATKTEALAKVGKVDKMLAAQKPLMNAGLSAIADALSGKLMTRELATILATIRDFKATCEALDKAAKVGMIKVLKERGVVTTEKGSRELDVGGWHIGMKPYRTGVDGKKVEALLRAKGKDPAAYMATTLSYSYDPARVMKAVEDQTLSLDELKTCEYDESWTLETPTKSKEE